MLTLDVYLLPIEIFRMKSLERWTLGACFVVSGATGLILQVAWSKELSYILGSTLYGSATVVAAFMAGRFSPRMRNLAPAPIAVVDSQSGERILMVAVGDYLERSQMVLIELANASPRGPLDISAEQERAGDLVNEARLYRQTAAHTGDTAVASVLEELERVLVDITHAPSHLSPQELETIRSRLQAEGILFKIRVLGSNVRDPKNQEIPAPTAGQKL